MPKIRTCRECGTELDKAHDARARFCCSRCRQAFNHRRAKRGAELYDLFMCLRYDRKLAKARGCWSAMCRLGELYRDNDNIERGARQSWQAMDKLSLWPKVTGRTILKPR